MSIWQAVGLTLLPNVGGFVGSIGTFKEIKTWFESIEKPRWRPPNWAFGPVWTMLYTGMGYASYLVLRDGVGEPRKLALGLYATQLTMNWVWTPVFFKYHRLGLSSIISCMMAVNIAACIYNFYPINKYAAYLMMPYLAWVSFASIVNIDMWYLNKDKKLN